MRLKTQKILSCGWGADFQIVCLQTRLEVCRLMDLSEEFARSVGSHQKVLSE